MRVSIFLLICFVSISLSEKLSIAEDEELSKSCGRLSNPASTSTDELSPWTVRLNMKNIYYPGTLISKRHILTSALVFLEKDGDQWKWDTDGSIVDATSCRNEVMEIPAISAIEVNLRSCSNRYLCPDRPHISVKSVSYLGTCDSSEFSSGVLLIEMAEDIPEYPEYFTPVCLPESTDVITDGESLHTHQAYRSDQSPIVKIVPTKVTTACDESSNTTICTVIDECLAPGGGLMKKMNGRDTVFGFSNFYYGKCNNKNFGSVTYNRKSICDLAGICKKTSSELPKPKSAPPPISLVNPFKRLSSAENTQNAATCGKPTNPGSNAPFDSTPWSVTALVPNTKGDKYYYPATVISKRHVVLLSFALIDEKKDDRTIKIWKDESVIDWSTCKNNVMEIPKEQLSRVEINLSVCNDRTKCGVDILHSVKSGIYLGVCNYKNGNAFGAILLEMDKDLPSDFPYFVPSCLAEKRIPELDENFKLHSIGWGTDAHTSTISEVKTVECESNTLQYYSKVCFKSPSCNQDNSGGIMKNVDGRETLVGVKYYDDRACKKTSHFVSMEILSDLICLYAGICGKTNADTTGNQNSVVPPDTTVQKTDTEKTTTRVVKVTTTTMKETTEISTEEYKVKTTTTINLPDDSRNIDDKTPDPTIPSSPSTDATTTEDKVGKETTSDQSENDETTVATTEEEPTEKSAVEENDSTNDGKTGSSKEEEEEEKEKQPVTVEEDKIKNTNDKPEENPNREEQNQEKDSEWDSGDSGDSGTVDEGETVDSSSSLSMHSGVLILLLSFILICM